MAQIFTSAFSLPFKSSPNNQTPFHFHSHVPSPGFLNSFSPSSSIFRQQIQISREEDKNPKKRGIFANQRGFRKISRKPNKKKKNLKLNVSISIEQGLPEAPEILDIAETLRQNVPLAMTLALNGLKDSDYKTRDTAIDQIDEFESAELSLLLCNDDFIRELNKEWRDEDCATDVLSMSQHIPQLKLPVLMMGDVVISVETASRQAEERGHTLLDEIRILME